MARVLVTGATGFIGNHVVKLLSKSGLNVTCFVRKSSNIEQLKAYGLQIRFGDIRDPKSVTRAVRNQDLILHLAGLTKSFRTRELHAVNGAGTGNVVNSCLKLQTPPTLIIVSSLAAAGPAPPGRLRIEADPPRPVSQYGKSKLLAERLAIQRSVNRMPLTIVRPPIVFGEGDRDGFPLFSGIAKWGVHLVPTFHDHPFSVIHAEDLATAVYKLALDGRRVESHDGTAGIYFVAANEHPTYAGLGHLIGQAVGRTHVRVLYSSGILVKVMGATNQLFGWVRQRPQIFNYDKAKEAVAGSWACSSAKIYQETGFSPAKTLKARLRQTAEWYAAQGLLQIGQRRPQRIFRWKEKSVS